MKVKCIQLLNSDGENVEFSPWLTLGRIYHVMCISISKDGERKYGILSGFREDEWPLLGLHSEKCFQIVSEIKPSNWRELVFVDGTDVSPAAWQEPGFYEDFNEFDPRTYPIFERERDIILHEDP